MLTFNIIIITIIKIGTIITKDYSRDSSEKKKIAKCTHLKQVLDQSGHQPLWSTVWNDEQQLTGNLSASKKYIYDKILGRVNKLISLKYSDFNYKSPIHVHRLLLKCYLKCKGLTIIFHTAFKFHDMLPREFTSCTCDVLS